WYATSAARMGVLQAALGRAERRDGVEGAGDARPRIRWRKPARRLDHFRDRCGRDAAAGPDQRYLWVQRSLLSAVGDAGGPAHRHADARMESDVRRSARSEE